MILDKNIYPPDEHNDDHPRVIGGFVNFTDQDGFGHWVNIERIVAMDHSQPEGIYAWLDIHMDTSDTEAPHEYTVKWYRIFTPNPMQIATDIALAL